LSDDDGIYVDFFAGSGTTGHAVMAQNAADGGDRRYILVQLPEPLDPENKDQKTAAEFCDKLGKPRTIAELTKERLRRAAKKIKEEHPDWNGDTGFRVFKLDSSNIRAWEPDRDNLEQTLLDHVEHIKDGRTEQDILYELLLKLGLDLCVPIETKTIAGKTVHSIGGGVLLACLATEITREDVEPLAQGIIAWHQELAPAGDTTCVFRDSAFADDVAKTNLAAILNQHGLTNVRSL
jgi:adenine-specific DNA-methyltransferase